VRAPEPLTRTELQRLWRWERDMGRFHTAAIAALLVCALAIYLYSDIAWARRSVLVAVIALVAAATVLQLRERCPRCNARLRTKTLLRLPARCHFCGVAFERPPPEGA
jgi:hypothetical protein